MITRIVIVIAIIAALWQPSKAQTQQSDEIVWLKYGQDIGLGDIVNAVFTPDDQSILVTDVNKKLIEIDAVTGDIKREIPNIKGVFKFSDDGQYVYTYDFKKVNYLTGEEIGQFKLGNNPVTGFTMFDLNEKAGYLIGVQYEWSYPYEYWSHSIIVFDINTFKFVDTLGIERNYYYDIKITEDGKYFKTVSKYDPNPEVTGDEGYISMLWDPKTLKTIQECPEFGYIKTSPDGKWLGSVGSNLVRVFDANTLEKKFEWEQGTGCCLSAIDFSSDSKYMATCGLINSTSDGGKKIGDIYVWDLNIGDISFKYSNGTNLISNQDKICYNQKNTYLLGITSGGIMLYNSIITSVENISENKQPILYPNPTTGLLTIRNSKIIMGNLYIDLSTISGSIVKVLFNGIYEGTELRFNISDIATGTYILNAVQNNKTYTYKIVKEY